MATVHLRSLVAVAVALSANGAHAQEPAPAPATTSAPIVAAPATASEPAPAPADVAPVVAPPAAATTPTPAPTPAAPSAVPPPTPTAAPPTAPVAPKEISPPPPRLTLAGGVVFGPHAHGEATCQDVEGGYACEHTGNFLGVGASLELRGQLYKPLYLHVRALGVGNVRKLGVHSGLLGGGVGLGAYSRYAFVRGEYMLLPTLGSDRYTPPFYDKPAARDVWWAHMGMVSVGVRKPVSPRAALELWGGVVIGPRAKRVSVTDEARQDRVIVSFMVSLGFAYDVLMARGYVPPPRQPRQRRQF